MIIRDIRAEDIPHLISMLRQFHFDHEFPGKAPVDEKTASEFFAKFLDTETAGALIAERNGEVVGAFGFIVLGHPWAGIKTVYKTFWYARKDAPGIGRELLRQIIALCRIGEVKQLYAGSMTKRVNRLLEREGFSACETNFVLEF